MQERTKGRWERHEQTKLRGWLVLDAFPSRASAVPAPVRSEVTNWSQIETRVSDKALLSLARELTPSARYTVLHENTHRNASSRSGAAYLSTSLSISRSKSVFVNSVSIYHESWRSKKKSLKNQRTIALASINFKREISFGNLKDLEITRRLQIIHGKCSNNLLRKLKSTTVVLTFY